MANGWTGDVWKRILGEYFQAYGNRDFNTVDERNFAHDAALGVLADYMDDADDPRADVIRRQLHFTSQNVTPPPHQDRAFPLSGDRGSGGKRSIINNPDASPSLGPKDFHDGSRYLLAHHPRLGQKIGVYLQMSPEGTYHGRVEPAAYYTPEEFRDFASKHPPEVAQQMHDFIDSTHPLPKEPPRVPDHNAPVKQKASVGNPSSFSDAPDTFPEAVLVAAYAQARAEGDDEACARIRSMAGKRTFAEGDALGEQVRKTYNQEFRDRATKLHEGLSSAQQEEHKPILDEFNNLDHFGTILRMAKGDDNIAADVANQLLYGTPRQKVGSFFHTYDPDKKNLVPRFLANTKYELLKHKRYTKEVPLSQVNDMIDPTEKPDMSKLQTKVYQPTPEQSSKGGINRMKNISAADRKKMEAARWDKFYDDPNRQELMQRVKDLRDRGLHMREIGEEVGLDRRTIANILTAISRGRLKPPPKQR